MSESESQEARPDNCPLCGRSGKEQAIRMASNDDRRWMCGSCYVSEHTASEGTEQ